MSVLVTLFWEDGMEQDEEVEDDAIAILDFIEGWRETVRDDGNGELRTFRVEHVNIP